MFGVWYSISMTVSNTNGSTCYPLRFVTCPALCWTRCGISKDLGCRYFGQKLEEFGDEILLITLVRLLSLHFAYLISRFFQSCTNQQHLDVFARIPNHSLYWIASSLGINLHQIDRALQLRVFKSWLLRLPSMVTWMQQVWLQEVWQRWWFGKTVGCNGSTDLWLFFSEPGVQICTNSANIATCLHDNRRWHL